MNRKHLAEHYRVYSNEIKPGITEEIKMSKKLVSDLLVDYLERRGVTKLFGLCGHTVIGMLDALSRSEKIEYIGTRHESVASTAADGYARVTHKVRSNVPPRTRPYQCNYRCCQRFTGFHSYGCDCR